jgi:uroporphyrinogen III methyltransferase/synthase
MGRIKIENTPLFQRRIINTRARHQSSELTHLLTDLGAEVIEFPTIEIVYDTESSDLKDKIDNIKSYDWLIFTSTNGVHAFFQSLLKNYNDIRALGTLKIAGVGSGTSKAINSYHINADIIAKTAVAEGLIDELESVDSWPDKRVLFPRAEKARDILPDTLSSWGAKVHIVTVYKNEKPQIINGDIIKDILEDRYDLVTFTSSSTFKNFISLFNEEDVPKVSQNMKAASIGPITSATMSDFGVKPLFEAKDHTIPGLVKSIEEYFR